MINFLIIVAGILFACIYLVARVIASCIYHNSDHRRESEILRMALKRANK